MPVVVAFVGKPSSGKSSFLNAITDAAAKVGPIPFTTIKPNHGIAYVHLDCPCKTVSNSPELCKPRYGKCEDGKRWVPIEAMDVAGLVPGASEGKGLGNQFLDDIRHADALIHVVDVSGTTDEQGHATTGYDPINDIDWLKGEMHSWIYNNLYKKWDNTKRRYLATKSSIVDSLQLQLGGYGTTKTILSDTLDRFPNKSGLDEWGAQDISDFVNVFLQVRFPTVIALNKIDLPDSDKNIERICRKYDQNHVVLTSALVETFLRKLDKTGTIKYHTGTDRIDTHDDSPVLPALDEKTKRFLRLTRRIEKVQDLVLFRYGNTGVQECLARIVELLGLIPVYPVANINNFASKSGKQNGIFRDCMFVAPGTAVRELAGKVHPDLEKYYNYAETVGSIRLGEDDLISHSNNIISYRTTNHLAN